MGGVVEPRKASTQQASETTILTTAIYVTGTARLEPGRRYGIGIQGTQLRVLGPIDLDSKRVALERAVVGLEVNGLEGRLILSDGRRADFVLAFMSVAGAGPAALAEAIRASLRGVEP